MHTIAPPTVPAEADAPPLSLFARIQAELRRRILQGVLAPGEKLPPEAALQTEFGVSRITVRQALSTLHASGLITTINGKGSFVTRATDAPLLGPLTGFYEHMRTRGHHAHGRLVSVRHVKADAHAASALRVAVGTALTAVTMVRLVDNTPLAIGIAHGHDALLQALLREDIETNDVMTLLESRLGYRLRSTHIETSAQRAGKLRARQLGITPEDPVLRIDFTPHDIDDQPLIYSQMYFRGDAFRYKAVVKR